MMISGNTELEAVNAILFTIGESPVNSLEATTSVDVINARTLLTAESRKVQDQGWTFNTQEGVFIPSDSFSKMIPWRSNWLRVMDGSSGSPYTRRSGNLYDRTSRTDLFPSGVTVELIEEVPFDELPYCFQTYITCKAARRFNGGSFGDPNTDTEIARQEQEAKIACNEYELDYGKYSIFTDAHVQGLLGRG